MIPVLRSLDEITTGYTVFEKDQVLTEKQLNNLVSYLDDQDRLTRVTLLGVGIACGLRASAVGAKVRVSKGVGVTTDGDLLTLGADTTFDRFKPYDETAPKYAPLYVDDKMIPVFELVRETVRDDRGVALDQFGAQTGKALGDMAAVLLMESCVKDPDLCSGSDCDNLGQDAVHTTKLLLIEKTFVAALLEKLVTPRGAAAALNVVVADRPLIPTGATTLAALVAPYRAACNTIHGKLTTELTKLYPACGVLLADIFPTDPSGAWASQLKAINEKFAATDAGIQYYYDFLKDLVETYNAFRHVLFEDTTVCCPEIEAFPKHLVLGNVVPGTDANENRTGVYPSPLVSSTLERWWHAKWLAAKLNVLIQKFELPAAGGPIRITPSRFEEVSLESRAIPCYYQVTGPVPIHQVWSFALARRGMGAYNYSYNAASYGAQGGAASPLTAQLGGLPLFRIEGHLGQTVTAAVTFLEGEIKSKNLPIALRSVLLGVDKGKIVVKPPPRFTDLHYMHQVVKQSVTTQLQDLTELTDNFRGEVDRAVDKGEITNPPNVDVIGQIKSVAFDRSKSVSDKASMAMQKLATKEPSWMADVSDAVTAAAQFKLELGGFTKTQFLAPIDALIAIPHAPWVDWLDDLIKVKDDKAEEKLLFSKFAATNAGIEHFAGVVRGGTFVLVYDGAGTVVADFMLPYYIETPEPEVEEPTLPPPKSRPPWTLPPTIRVQPPLERVFFDKLDIVKTQVDKQGVFIDVFKNPLPNVGGVVVGPKAQVDDLVLAGHLAEIDRTQALLDRLHAQVADPATDPATIDAVNLQITAAETNLARAAVDTGSYVASTGLPVAKGTDGYLAMTAVSRTVSVLKSPDALAVAKTGLAGAADVATNVETKTVIGNITRVKGF